MRDAQQQLDLTRETLRRRVRASFERHARGAGEFRQRFEVAQTRTRTGCAPSELQRSAPAFYRAAARIAWKMRKERFDRVEKILRVLGPEATLGRGYSMTTDCDGKSRAHQSDRPSENENSHSGERWRIRIEVTS